MYDKYILSKLKEEDEDIDVNILTDKIELSTEKGEKGEKEDESINDDEEEEENLK